MLKNDFDIIRIWGVMVTAFCLFIISIIIDEYISYRSYDEERFYTDEEIGIGLVILLGFAGGIGMIFAKKWGRIIIGSMIALATVGILILIVAEGDIDRNPVIGIGGLLLTLSLGGGILTILFNKKVDKELGKEEEEEYDDILDIG